MEIQLNSRTIYVVRYAKICAKKMTQRSFHWCFSWARILLLVCKVNHLNHLDLYFSLTHQQQQKREYSMKELKKRKKRIKSSKSCQLRIKSCSILQREAHMFQCLRNSLSLTLFTLIHWFESYTPKWHLRYFCFSNHRHSSNPHKSVCVTSASLPWLKRKPRLVTNIISI